MRWIKYRQRAVENWLGPFPSGLLEALLAIVILTAALWAISRWIPISHPSAEVFRDLAQVGSAIFVSFAIATAGGAAITGADLKLHLTWLGSSCGLGLAGFSGILTSIGLAAYREAGHASSLDLIGLCWAIASLVLLGCVVAALPYAVFRWSRLPSSS